VKKIAKWVPKFTVLLSLMHLLCTQVSFANEFRRGNREFEDPKRPPTLNDPEIQKRIMDEMDIFCDRDGLCRISGISKSGGSFTVSLNVGFGNQQNSGSTGSVVIVDGAGQQRQNEPSINAGITITYKHVSCESHILVIPPVYRWLATNFYQLVRPDGTTPRELTGSQNVAILFKSTILQRVNDCAGGL
jgi:hypothetical protein